MFLNVIVIKCHQNLCKMGVKNSFFRSASKLQRFSFWRFTEKVSHLAPYFIFLLQTCKLITVSGQTGAFVIVTTKPIIALAVYPEQDTARTLRLGHHLKANTVEEAACWWTHVLCLVCITVRLYVSEFVLGTLFPFESLLFYKELILFIKETCGKIVFSVSVKFLYF